MPKRRRRVWVRGVVALVLGTLSTYAAAFFMPHVLGWLPGPAPHFHDCTYFADGTWWRVSVHRSLGERFIITDPQRRPVGATPEESFEYLDRRGAFRRLASSSLPRVERIDATESPLSERAQAFMHARFQTTQPVRAVVQGTEIEFWRWVGNEVRIGLPFEALQMHVWSDSHTVIAEGGVVLGSYPMDWIFLPLRPLLPGFAINTALYASLWFFAIPLPGKLRRRRRRRKGLCPSCAYDLSGDLETGCPECAWNRA